MSFDIRFKCMFPTLPTHRTYEMSDLKGTAIVVAIVLTLVLVTVLLYPRTPQPTSQPAPPLNAGISLTLAFPRTLVSTIPTHVSLHVYSPTEGVTSLVLETDSSVLMIQMQPADINAGTAVNLDVALQALDVQDGVYSAHVWGQYSDSNGVHKSDPLAVNFFVVPNVKLSQLGWASDFFHPFGKGTIGATDSTTLLFKVTSQSHSETYQGLTAKVSFNETAPSLTVSPSTLSLHPIGPQGVSQQYSVTVTSNSTPPGVYSVILTLYSKDGQLAAQGTLQLTVTA
jgi:hypothetical protein